MSMFHRVSTAGLLALALGVPAVASAAPLDAECRVNITYSLNGAPSVYTMDFAVSEGVDFFDDFSTPTRFKEFRATASQATGRAVINIDYYNDVGVFSAVTLNTSLNMPTGRGARSTSGYHVYYTSQPSVAEHRTDWTLTCRRL